MTILKTISLQKVYQTAESSFYALDRVNLSIEEGEFVSIIGTSGSGKTTLLNLLGGLDYPTNGFVEVKHTNLSDLSDEELAIFRRRNIGFVFQNYNLIPVLTAYENIVLPLRLDGTEIDEVYLNELIKELGIEGKMNQLPNTLSGGQQQRVAIARALAAHPAIVLADEPTGNLDSHTTDEVMNLMKRIAKQFQQTMIVVTHDERVAEMAERVIQIEDGKIKL